MRKHANLFLWTFVLILLSSIVNAALTDNLVACMNMDDTTDAQGYYTFTNNGGSNAQAGFIGNAQHYDGSDYWQANDTLWDGAFTMGFWVNWNTTPSERYVYYVDDPSRPEVADVYFNVGKHYCRIRNDAGTQFSAIGNTINAGAWYFVICGWNTTHITIYENASYITSTAVNTLYTPTHDLFIGSNDAGTNAINADLDEFMIWNRWISSAEISEIYNSGVGKGCDTILGGGGSPTTDTLNISDKSLPITQTYTNLSDYGFNTTVNASLPFNCSLYFDNSINSTITGYQAGVNVLVNFTANFTINEESGYNYKINCYDNTTSRNTSIKSFNVDKIPPDFNSTIDTNNTKWVLSAMYNLNASDGLDLYKIVVGDQCGFTYTNGAPTNPQQHNLNSSLLSCGFGIRWVNISVCDNIHCTNRSFIINSTGRFYARVYTYAGTQLSNFSLYQNGVFVANSSITLQEINLDYLSAGVYNFTVDPTDYTLDSVVFNITSVYNAYNFTVFDMNAINFTFYDESTNQLIANNNLISVELISDVFSGNYTTLNASLYLTLLSPSSYTIRYSAINYSERFYYFNLVNRSYNTLPLYLGLNTSLTQVTATVYDESGNTVEDAYIKVFRYDQPSNTYSLTEIGKTNFLGETRLNLVLNDEFYKFIIDRPLGTAKLSTSPTYIYGTTLSFQINLGESVLGDYFKENDVTYSLVFNNITNNMRYTFTDSTNSVTRGCLYIYRLSNFKPQELYNTSCLNANSGTILIKLDNTTGIRYKGVAYVDFGNGLRYLTDLLVDFNQQKLGNKIGIFWLIIIMIVVATLFVWDKTIAVIATPLPMILWSALKLWDIPLGLTIAFEVLAIGIAVVISNKEK